MTNVILITRMRIKKHIEILKEVMEEIESALSDPGGLVKHQRRLAMMLSIGVAEIMEVYFHKKDAMKTGSRIQHQWFKLSKKNLVRKISQQISKPLDKIENIDHLMELGRDVERGRDDIAYGSPLSDEKLLKQKIDEFLELKNEIEREVGGLGL